MAQRRSVTISGPAGTRLFGGRLAPAGLSGSVAAGDAVASGAMGVAAAPPPPPAPAPAPAGAADIVALQITSASAGPLPWTVGHWFVKGDIPAGSALGGVGTSLQVEVRNTWPDGSVRFAAVSGITPAGTYTLRRGGSVATGANVPEPSIDAVLTLTDVRDHLGNLLHASLSASLATARAAGATAWDRTTPRRVRQALGPLMSEFHYYSPTAHPHLVVWWHVRAYSDGRVEVTTKVEGSCWLLVPGPGEWIYNVDLSVGGTSRYTATNLSHKHHTTWSRVDWIGGNPNVTPRHDTRYLMRTRMILTQGIRRLDAAVYEPYASTADQAERGTAFDLAQVNPGLGGGGHSDSYGVMPGWDSAHSIEAEPRLYWTVMRIARYASGRFHVHYRDESTGMPARGSTHINLRINGTNSGIHDNAGGLPATPAPAGALNSPGWFFSHGPALSYYAYGLSARWEFWEEAAFFSTTADLWQSDLNQSGGYRIAWWGLQLRQRAHIFRLRAQCALIAPRSFGGAAVTGADLGQVTEAEGRLNAEIDYYRQIYVAGGTNTEPRLVAHRNNALGLWAAGDSDGAVDGRYTTSGLQQALNIVPTLWAYDTECTTNANFGPLIEFTARWPLGLFGTTASGERWDWRMVSCYTLNVGVDNANPGLWTLDASWDALWTRLTTTYSWQVMGGGAAAPNPAVMAADKLLRTYQTRDGSNVAWIGPITQLDNTTDNFTATFHVCAAVGLLHQIASSGRLDALAPQCEWAAGLLYESDTWRNSMAAGSYLRSNVTYAQWGIKSGRYENLDDVARTLDLNNAARAAVAPTEWAWVQDNINTAESIFPPVGLSDDFAGGTTHQYIIAAWGGYVWNNRANAAEMNGTGHSAAGLTEWLRWQGNGSWRLSFYGAEQVSCGGGNGEYHRSVDFNSTPPAQHPYDTQCFGRIRGVVYQGYAGVFNQGQPPRVWDPAFPGIQPNGPDGLPGLRRPGIFEISMTQACTGKVVGQTGSNPARGAFAGTVLPGANAAKLHDWYGPGGANPTFDGFVQGVGIEASMAYSDEVPGKDSFYWVGGTKWVIHTTINNSNPNSSTHVVVGRESTAYGQGRGSVQIALDPVRRVIVVVTNDQDTNPGCVAFMDLTRPWGFANAWRSATLTGNPADIAEFLALNRLDMGVQHDPVSGKVLAYNGLGRQVWAFTPPAPVGGVTPDTGWALEKLPMNASLPAPPATADPLNTVGNVPGAEMIIGVNGKWKYAPGLRSFLFIEGARPGRTWRLLGPNYTDPRND